MAPRKRTGRGRGQGTNQVRTAQRVQRPLNNSQEHVRGWFSLDNKPSVPLGQTVINWPQNLHPGRVAGLNSFTNYKKVLVHSIGVRFKAGYTHSPGNIAIGVWTAKLFALNPPPNNATLSWMLQNDASRETKLINDLSGAPSSDGSEKTTVAFTNTTVLGHVLFVWEGPSQTAAMDRVGSVEMYLDATFSGR